jgi:hypothetical protein
MPSPTVTPTVLDLPASFRLPLQQKKDTAGLSLLTGARAPTAGDREQNFLGAAVHPHRDPYDTNLLAFPNLNISEHQCGFPLATS